MARVAVLHNTLDLRGGADAVCLHACAALDSAHDVTLVTLSRTDPADLGRLFDVAVDVPVLSPPWNDPVSRALDAAAVRVGPQLPLRSVLLDRFARRHLDGFDVAVSTANEFAPPLPSVQYVHYPQFNRHRIGEGGRLDGLYGRLAGVRSLPDDATVVANSGWTAGVVDRIYGRRPGVLHPPVDPIPDPLPWEERQPGFVSVGRLAPDKRVLDVVRIVEGVRERGHDVHLHLVGSAGRAYREYVRRVEAAAADRDWVHLEREVGRDGLETLLSTHRYGLAAKPDEHFGMAVAECVAAGMVAFAPNSGGQVEVLDGREDRLFGSVSEAVETVDAAIRAGARPEQPRDRFGRERFRRALRRLVRERLDRSSGVG